MKAGTSIIYLLTLLETSLSAAGRALNPSDHSVANIELKELSTRQQVIIDCNKLLDQVVGVMQSYPEYQTKVLAIGDTAGLGGLFAWSVCRAFKVDVLDCRYAGISITTGLALAIVHGFFDGEDESTEISTPDATERRDEKLAGRLEAHLRANGLAFDTMSTAIRTSNGRARPVVEIRGVKYPDHDGKSDFLVHSRVEGGGHVQLMPQTTSRSLEGRADAAGAKISWEVFDRAGTPAQYAYNTFAGYAVDDWVSRAEDDDLMGEYIGWIDFAGVGNIQFRISPQPVGEDSDYLDVDTCKV